MRKLIIRNFQSPGDIVLLTAAVLVSNFCDIMPSLQKPKRFETRHLVSYKEERLQTDMTYPVQASQRVNSFLTVGVRRVRL